MKTVYEITRMIDLQDEVVSLVNETYKNLNIKEYDDYIKGLLDIQTAPDARTKLIEVLGEDLNNMKILTCMLFSLTYTYERYCEKGINEEIFIDTMKAFTRFLEEHYSGNLQWKFDRDWWIYRQIAMTIFRIGELEYEMKETEQEKYISIHIPSDTKLSEINIIESIKEAKIFFSKYYPEFTNVEYRCHSWLLSSDLDVLLPPSSNIIKFKSMFRIISESNGGTGFLTWIYKRKYEDFNDLPEDTTLQRNLKRHLLSGKSISTAYGILK